MVKRLREFLEDIRVAFYVFVILWFLTGCATTRVEYRTADIPEPPVITRPALPTDGLTAGQDAGTVLQLHRETIKVLQSWGKELEEALNAYRKKSSPGR